MPKLGGRGWQEIVSLDPDTWRVKLYYAPFNTRMYSVPAPRTPAPGARISPNFSLRQLANLDISGNHNSCTKTACSWPQYFLMLRGIASIREGAGQYACCGGLRPPMAGASCEALCDHRQGMYGHGECLAVNLATGHGRALERVAG